MNYMASGVGSFDYMSIRSVSTTRRDMKVSNMAWDI